MPRSNTEDWVDAIRVFIRDTLGNQNWQIVQNKGKVMLGVRFDDKSRSYKYLGYKWQRINAPKIRKAIEDIHDLHINKNIPFDEAFARVRAQVSKGELPRAKTDGNKILEAWAKYEKYKVKQTGETSQKTWNKEYGKMIFNENGVEEPKGKTYRLLLQVVEESQNAKALLNNIGKFNEPGSDYRTKRVQIVRSFLEWAVSEESDYLLPLNLWEPPAKGQISKIVGKKSAKKKEEDEKPTYAMQEKEILELINYLDNPPEGMREDMKARAKEWSFPIKLIATYGLRPLEIFHLTVKKNGIKYAWCSYIKKSAGYTKPRRLIPLHEEWEQEWNLLEMIENKVPLPACSSGAGQGFRDYLKHNPIWKRLREEHENVVPYSFRHGYAWRGHRDYLIHPNELCGYMGHNIKSHKKYGIYFDEQSVEDSFRRAQARRSKNMHTSQEES